jgi:hypothetical protein
VPDEVYTGQDYLDGVVFPTDFHFEMIDPVLGRNISHGYEVISLEPTDSLSL